MKMTFDSKGSFSFGGQKIGWKLKYRSGGEFVQLLPGEMKKFRSEETSDGFRQIWEGHETQGDCFKVICHWKAHGKALHGKLSYSGACPERQIHEVIFPSVTMEHPDNRILLPHDIGYLSGPLQEWELTVPSPERFSFHPFQFFGFFSQAGNLYAGCLDNRHWNKSFDLTTRDNPRTADLDIIIPVARTRLAAKRWSVPFAVALEPFEGSWFNAALIYRRWAHRQQWYRNRIKDNPLKDTGIWFWNRGEADDVMAPVEEFVKRSGVPAALDWYFWHSNPYDTDYPDFWPPRAGEEEFRKAVERMNSQNIFLQVYINGVIWDIQHREWADGGDDSAVMTADGNVFSVPFNRYNGHRLAYICGEGEPFFKRIYKLVDHLTGAGLKSVYLDLIGCASTVIPCCNPRHKHAPGGGFYQAEGYRKMIKSLRERHPGVAFSTEEGAEKYLDLVESMILLYPSHERIGYWNLAQRMKGEYVPVFTAVYHGSTALFGNFAIPDNIPAWDPLWPDEERYKAEDEQEWTRIFPDQFPLEFTRGIIWGMQPTVCNLRKGQADNPATSGFYDFAVTCARFYYDNRDLLFSGTMLPPGELKTRCKKVRLFKRGTYSKRSEVAYVETESPVILHSCWQSPGGRKALVMINWDSEPAEWSWEGRSGTLAPRTCCAVELEKPCKETGANMDFVRKTDCFSGVPEV